MLVYMRIAVAQSVEQSVVIMKSINIIVKILEKFQ